MERSGTKLFERWSRINFSEPYALAGSWVMEG